MFAVRHAKMLNHRTMNPCPLYDDVTKTVFLFFICVQKNYSEMWQILTGKNAARICYVTSTDYGQSWSSLVDVTKQVMANDLKNCATVAVGPGHGIRSTSGRLTVPAYLYYIHTRVCGLPLPWRTKPHSFIFYSDDHGKSWHRGSTVWQQQTGECEVAEVARSNGSGILYCSSRTNKQFRVEATSSNQAMGFDSSHFCHNLCEPPHGCQGSVVSYQPLEIHKATDDQDGCHGSVVSYKPLEIEQAADDQDGCQGSVVSYKPLEIQQAADDRDGCQGSVVTYKPLEIEQAADDRDGCHGSVVSYKPLEIQQAADDRDGCHGSVVSYKPLEIQQAADDRDGGGHTNLEKRSLSWLLYSHPTNKHQRVDLGIYLNKSPLLPAGWQQPWIINKGPSGYSDLAVSQGNHAFGCLFECGVDACEKIAFRRFTVEELMENLSVL